MKGPAADSGPEKGVKSAPRELGSKTIEARAGPSIPSEGVETVHAASKKRLVLQCNIGG